MEQTKPYEGELTATMPIEVPPKEESTINSWVTRLILAALQIIVAISIFQLFKDMVFTHGSRPQVQTST